MTTIGASPAAMKTFRVIGGLALLAAAVASIALAWLAWGDPAQGTTLYDTLERTAAASGIAAGLLFGAAAIWAAVKRLWEHVPMWVRGLATLLIVIIAIVGAVSRGGS